MPNIPSTNGGIKITATDFGGNTAADSSGKIFEIYYPSVTLQSLANTTVKISELILIKWSTASVPAVQSVDLYYTVDDGVNWTLVKAQNDAVTASKWQHLVVTRSGTSVNWYIDGVVDSGGVQTLSSDDNMNGTLTFGVKNSINYFNGKLELLLRL